MIVLRANPLGGRPLRDGVYPLKEDKRGNFGFCIGYVDKDTIPGDPIIIKTMDATDIANRFGEEISRFKRIKNLLGLGG